MPLRFPPYTLAVILLACVTASAGADSQPTLLTYRLVPGETLRYKLDARIKGAAPILGSPTPADLDLGVTLVYAAEPRTLLADGSADVEFKVESVDVRLLDTPLPGIGVEDVQKVLNQRVTLAKTGEIRQVAGGAPLPFGVSVPGVDPKRLYTLLFPVVFETRPVKTGESWKYSSQLLGTDPKERLFTATVLPPGEDPGRITRIRQQFAMRVDQALDADDKPVANGATPHRTQKGQIGGTGLLLFDRVRGLFTRGDVTLNASLVDTLVGQPKNPDDPREVASRIHAVVTVELLTGQKQEAP